MRKERDMRSDFYRPRRAYEFDCDTKQIVGRFFFIIAGEMSDGTKCWYKCDENGEIIEETANEWYSMTRKAGRLIAILEGV